MSGGEEEGPCYVHNLYLVTSKSTLTFVELRLTFTITAACPLAAAVAFRKHCIMWVLQCYYSAYQHVDLHHYHLSDFFFFGIPSDMNAVSLFCRHFVLRSDHVNCASIVTQ